MPETNHKDVDKPQTAEEILKQEVDSQKEEILEDEDVSDKEKDSEVDKVIPPKDFTARDFEVECDGDYEEITY